MFYPKLKCHIIAKHASYKQMHTADIVLGLRGSRVQSDVPAFWLLILVVHSQVIKNITVDQLYLAYFLVYSYKFVLARFTGSSNQIKLFLEWLFTILCWNLIWLGVGVRSIPAHGLGVLLNIWGSPLIFIQWLKLANSNLVHSLCLLKSIIQSHPKEKVGVAVC